MTKTTRINTGLYQMTHKGRIFQIEDHKQATDGEGQSGWMVYEMFGDRREWLNDFVTKSRAIERTVQAVEIENALAAVDADRF